MKVAVLLMLTLLGCGKGKKEGPGSGLSIDDYIRRLEGLTESACACRDTACADAAVVDAERWADDFARDPSVGTPTPEQAKRIEALGKRQFGCRNKARSGGIVSP